MESDDYDLMDYHLTYFEKKRKRELLKGRVPLEENDWEDECFEVSHHPSLVHQLEVFYIDADPARLKNGTSHLKFTIDKLELLFYYVMVIGDVHAQMWIFKWEERKDAEEEYYIKIPSRENVKKIQELFIQAFQITRVGEPYEWSTLCLLLLIISTAKRISSTTMISGSTRANVEI